MHFDDHLHAGRLNHESLLWDGATEVEARETLAWAREGVSPDAVIIREEWDPLGEQLLHTEVLQDTLP